MIKSQSSFGTRALGAAALGLLLTVATSVGCQKSEQASVQPEKLASSSPSSGAEGAPSGSSTTTTAAASAPSGSAPGPLLPLAEGAEAPAKTARPTTTTEATSKPLAPYAKQDKPCLLYTSPSPRD